jgi:hypothetical protein
MTQQDINREAPRPVSPLSKTEITNYNSLKLYLVTRVAGAHQLMTTLTRRAYLVGTCRPVNTRIGIIQNRSTAATVVLEVEHLSVAGVLLLPDIFSNADSCGSSAGGAVRSKLHVGVVANLHWTQDHITEMGWKPVYADD